MINKVIIIIIILIKNNNNNNNKGKKGIRNNKRETIMGMVTETEEKCGRLLLCSKSGRNVPHI